MGLEDKVTNLKWIQLLGTRNNALKLQVEDLKDACKEVLKILDKAERMGHEDRLLALAMLQEVLDRDLSDYVLEMVNEKTT